MAERGSFPQGKALVVRFSDNTNIYVGILCSYIPTQKGLRRNDCTFRHRPFSISLSQVEACSSFSEAEASFDGYAERPVDEGGGDVDLEVKVRQGSLDIGGAEEFDDGDEGCDGGAFEEIQDFVGHHGESEGECLRKDDVLHGAVGGKAYDLGGFDLSFGDGVEGGVEDFRKVGSGVEAKSDDGIGKWRDLGDEGEICLTADHEEDHRQSVEDDVKDDECRYGASEKDIGLGDTLQDGDAVDAGKGCPKSQHNRKKEREEEKFQRRRKVGRI